MASSRAARLQSLRRLFTDRTVVSRPICAFLVFTDDAHQSEYVCDTDKRREFISGFTGSAGTALVTTDKAMLWTDGRYFLQASQQLDSNWTLMKAGMPGTPHIRDWIVKNLAPGSAVGVDPHLISSKQYLQLESFLSRNGQSLLPVTRNLVDIIWTEQPARPRNPVTVLPITISGETIASKLERVRKKMNDVGCSVMVVSALDDVAWLFNLRGSDISYNPVFFSYALITANNVYLFVDESKLNEETRQHLAGVTIRPYEEVVNVLKSLASGSVEAESKGSGRVWLSSNYALYSAVPPDKVYEERSFISELKCVKNETEVETMRRGNARDSVALCEYLLWLENQLDAGKTVTEAEGAEVVDRLRAKQAHFVSISFDTISSSGCNGAIIHYKPVAGQDRPITKTELYLVDSGGQYSDGGTTDVTRTVHFGEPTSYERDCFTRVLKGNIALCRQQFPRGVTGMRIDPFARNALWQTGKDYMHGTGHGVGAFLNVHEGPLYIGSRAGVFGEEFGLTENMIVSDEPGYYEEGKFGIRIENTCLIVLSEMDQSETDRSGSQKETRFIHLEPLTLVPIQQKMINVSLLDDDDLQWLNDYHQRVGQVVGQLLAEQGKSEVAEWLQKQTRPMERQ